MATGSTATFPFEYGLNTITVSAVTFTRSVKLQVSSGEVEFDALSLNGVALTCPIPCADVDEDDICDDEDDCVGTYDALGSAMEIVRPMPTATGCVTTWTIALVNLTNVASAMEAASCREHAIVRGILRTPWENAVGFVRLTSTTMASATRRNLEPISIVGKARSGIR